MDRRILDKIVGLDTEISELMEASHLYTPNVSMVNVVLPSDIKDSVISTISSFDKYKKYRRDAGLDDILSYGSGMVLLFCGPSGTGEFVALCTALLHSRTMCSLTLIITQAKPCW
jgi:hypothetical protein